MEAGKLRHYATLQNKVIGDTATSRGYPTGSGSGDIWQDIATAVPTEIVTLVGREAENARQIVASADHRIRLRYISGVSTRSRFVWNSRIFNVVWFNNVDQQDRELICLCTEVFGTVGGEVETQMLSAPVETRITNFVSPEPQNKTEQLFHKFFGGK